MDEKTQIEEMASIINGSLVSEYYPEPEYIPTAKELYNAGYRKQEWISVEDELPEEVGLYLSYTLTGGTKFAWFCSPAEGGNPRFENGVTHWLPLPQPPKMKGGAE